VKNSWNRSELINFSLILAGKWYLYPTLCVTLHQPIKSMCHFQQPIKSMCHKCAIFINQSNQCAKVPFGTFVPVFLFQPFPCMMSLAPAAIACSCNCSFWKWKMFFEQVYGGSWRFACHFTWLLKENEIVCVWTVG